MSNHPPSNNQKDPTEISATPSRKHQLALTRLQFEQITKILFATDNATHCVTGLLHQSQTDHTTSFTVTEIQPENQTPISVDQQRIYIQLATDLPQAKEAIDTPDFSLRVLAKPCVHMLLTADGYLLGRVYYSLRSWASIDMLLLPGCGIHKIEFIDGVSATPIIKPDDSASTHSRLIGVLGRNSWQRLTATQFAIVGIGRNGSLVANTLARMGVSRLSLIDHDKIEDHNLDAMDNVLKKDIGQFKTTAIAHNLVAINLDISVADVPCSISQLNATNAIKDSDFLISCLDNDAARLAATIISTLYSKPLLDIASGIVTQDGKRHLGGDIRLLLPGECHCLFCLAALDQSRAMEIFDPPTTKLSWHHFRDGSLRSLNQVVTHLGIRLLEELAQENIHNSIWQHITFDQNQQVQINHVPLFAKVQNCPICAQAFMADRKFSKMQHLKDKLSAIITNDKKTILN